MDGIALAISKPSGNEGNVTVQTLAKTKERKQVTKTLYGATIARKIGTQGRFVGSFMASPPKFFLGNWIEGKTLAINHKSTLLKMEEKNTRRKLWLRNGSQQKGNKQI